MKNIGMHNLLILLIIAIITLTISYFLFFINKSFDLNTLYDLPIDNNKEAVNFALSTGLINKSFFEDIHN